MDNDINTLLRRAFADMNNDQTDDAILALKEILQIAPTNEIPWTALYESYLYDKKDKTAAYNVLEKVYSLIPTDFNILFAIGVYFEQEEINLRKSDYYFDLILKYHPNEAEANHYVGGSLVSRDSQKDIQKGLLLLHKAIEIDRSYIAPYITLAYMYNKMGEHNKAYALALQGCLNGKEVQGRGSINGLGRSMERIAKKIVNDTNISNKLRNSLITIITVIKSSVKLDCPAEYIDLISKMIAYKMLYKKEEFQPAIMLELEKMQSDYFAIPTEEKRNQEALIIGNLSFAYLLKQLFGVSILKFYHINDDIKNKVSIVWKSYRQSYDLVLNSNDRELNDIFDS